MKRLSQKQLILDALKRGERLTPRLAMERYDSMALHSRIAELRAEGHEIKGRLQTIRRLGAGHIRYGVYWMEVDA